MLFNKRISNDSLDERQVQTRNRIGNQCFFILLVSMVFALQLPNFGITWATTSIIMTVILLLCSGYFIARIAWAGAGGYNAYNTKASKKLYLVLGFITVILTFQVTAIKSGLFKNSLSISHGGLLLIYILIFLTMIIVPIIISKYKNNQGDDQ